MKDNEVQAAIVTLLTVGILFLNVGADMVQKGQIEYGVFVGAIGAVFIVISVVLIKLLAIQTARMAAYGTGETL